MTQPIERSTLQLGAKIKDGAQGTIFEVVNLQLSGRPAVYKEYKAAVRYQVNDRALDALIDYLRTGAHGGEWLLERAAWPCVRVVEDGRTRGFLMLHVPAHFYLTMQLSSGRKRRVAETQHLLNDDAYLRGRDIRVTDQLRLELLQDFTQTLRELHADGITIGDLSPNNLLFSSTGRPRCHLLDCDSMQIAGASVLPQLQTTDWEATGEALATPASDTYKLGLLALRLFAQSQSVSVVVGSSRVPAGLRPVVTQSLSAAPSARPSMVEWSAAIDLALRDIRSVPVVTIAAPPAAATVAAPTYTIPPPAPDRRKPRRRLAAGAAAAAVAAAVGVVAFLNLGGGATPTPAAAGPATTATHRASPVPPPVLTPAEELRRLQSHDRPLIENELVDHWVPQLASTSLVVPDNGQVQTSASILSQHRALRSGYGAVLLNSSDYVYLTGDFWVSVVPIGYDTADEALDWCRQHGLSNDHCYAKLLTHDSSITDTAEHQ